MMLKRERVLVLLLSIALLGTAVPVSRVSAANGTALLVPSYQNISIGEVRAVTFRVQNVQNMYGYQVDITYNPALLGVIDADPSKTGVQVALGTFLKPEFVQHNNVNTTTGVISVIVTQLAPTAPVSGSGDLFAITFEGTAQGISNVRFTDLKLAAADGTEISVVRQDAQVAVGNVNAPTPTATHTPTFTPTPTPTPATGWTPTPTPTFTPTPPPGQTVIHVVRMGDTMYSIARMYGTTVEAIAHLNNISNPSYIQVGQQLIIPRGPYTPAPTVTPPAGPCYYVVQRGDTLYSIARRYGTTVEAIAIANNIANPSLIYVGQRLTIPNCGHPVPTPPIHRVHVVQRGETLCSIARLYGTTYWAIAMANNLPNPNIIYVGQRLVIP